ncbi:MAG TPA: hypothetical protein VGI39_45805 [Polyangiaceae bacterium]
MAGVLAFGAAVALGSGAGCGSEDGVVGGDCAPGYTQCALACFDLLTDPNNCGACGHVCPPGASCVEGVCSSDLDATSGGDGADLDGADLLIDGELCDVRDPAHPVCRPRPDGETGDDDGNGGGDGTIGDGNGGGDGSNNGDGSTGNGDGSNTGDGSNDSDGSNNGDGAIGDGSNGEGGVLTDACVPPFDTPQNCGSCGNACVNPNPVCSLGDGGFQCVPQCTPPLTDCSGRCVNLTRDPSNCGACGVVCPSQYCFQSMCQGSVAGNVMVIGHDFQKTAGNDQEAKLLDNSVFYNAGSVALLSFEHYADPATVQNGLGILKAYAAAQHITLDVQSTQDDTSLSNDTLLTSETAVIVWDQPNAAAGALGTLGTACASHLSKFVIGGGIVIALDAAQGRAEMPAFITNAGLLAVTGHAAVTPGTPADVPLAGLSIARGMTSVYLVEQNTAWFSTSEAASAKTLFVANVQGQTTQLLAVQKVIN